MCGPTTVRHTTALVRFYSAKSLKEKVAATSLCNSLRTTIPFEQASEIDCQPNHVRGCDNARHLRMAGVVTIGTRSRPERICPKTNLCPQESFQTIKQGGCLTLGCQTIQ